MSESRKPPIVAPDPRFAGAPRLEPRKPTVLRSPAPPAPGSAPMPELAPLASPPNQGCTKPPAGWYCSREPGHSGPCAARPIVPATLSGLGRLPPPLPASARLPLPPPLPRVESSPKLLEAARVLTPPKSDPFPAAEAPTPVKRALPFRAGAIAPGTSQVARTFRNYEALTEENKRLVDGIVLALRGTVDGGR